METTRLFWADVRRPDGKRIRVEARSYRDLVSEIRFLAAVENARLMRRGPIPDDVAYCLRCHDLVVEETSIHSAVCGRCVEELAEGEGA